MKNSLKVSLVAVLMVLPALARAGDFQESLLTKRTTNTFTNLIVHGKPLVFGTYEELIELADPADEALRKKMAVITTGARRLPGLKAACEAMGYERAESIAWRLLPLDQDRSYIRIHATEKGATYTYEHAKQTHESWFLGAKSEHEGSLVTATEITCSRSIKK